MLIYITTLLKDNFINYLNTSVQMSWTEVIYFMANLYELLIADSEKQFL